MSITYVQSAAGDDTTRIQNAIDSLESGGIAGATVVLTGEYSIASALASTGVSIMGVNATIVQTTANTASVAVASATKVTISGIRFASSLSQDEAITLDTSDDCLIADCDFTGYSGNAITTIGDCSGLVVRDSRPPMGDIINVYPTGDADADTTAIQDALTSLSYDASGDGYYRQGTVRLSGQYSLIRPLTSGGTGLRPVSIDGQGHTGITVATGFPADSYAFNFSGSGRSRCPLLRGIALTSWYKSYGAKFDGLSYRVVVEDCMFYAVAGIGIHSVIGCAVSINNVLVSIKGASIILDNAPSSSLTDIKIGGNDTMFPSGLAEEQKAGIYVSGGNITMRQIVCETNTYNTYPIIKVNSGNTSITGLRFEKNGVTEYPIVVTANLCRIADVSGGEFNYYGGGAEPKAFIRGEGAYKGIQLTNARLSGLLDAIVSLSSDWTDDTSLTFLDNRDPVTEVIQDAP